MTEITTAVRLTVRFFAAARAAAGADTLTLTRLPGTTVADIVRELSDQSEEMRLVLRKCSFLCDGITVRDSGTVLRADQTLDVLPPFAGG